MRRPGASLAVVAAFAVWATPALATHSDRPGQLTQHQAREDLRSVLVSRYEARRYDRSCGRRSRWNFLCRVSWFVGDVSYRGVVVIWRTGNAHDSVDHYRTRLRFTNHYPGCRRSCRRTERDDGVFFQAFRDGPLGGELVLHAEDRVRLRIGTQEQLLDPLATGEFDQPDPGTRYVGIPLAVENIGSKAYRDSLSNGSRLVLAGGSTIDTSIVVTGPCDESSVNVPVGQERQACVAFQVPHGAEMQFFELTLESGFGPETGQWDLRG